MATLDKLSSISLPITPGLNENQPPSNSCVVSQVAQNTLKNENHPPVARSNISAIKLANGFLAIPIIIDKYNIRFVINCYNPQQMALEQLKRDGREKTDQFFNYVRLDAEEQLIKGCLSVFTNKEFIKKFKDSQEWAAKNRYEIINILNLDLPYILKKEAVLLYTHFFYDKYNPEILSPNIKQLLKHVDNSLINYYKKPHVLQPQLFLKKDDEEFNEFIKQIFNKRALMRMKLEPKARKVNFDQTVRVKYFDKNEEPEPKKPNIPMSVQFEDLQLITIPGIQDHHK